jgi:hypothetical protein
VELLQIPLQQLRFPFSVHVAPVPRHVQFPLLEQPEPQQSERHWSLLLQPKPATSRHPASPAQTLPEQQSSWPPVSQIWPAMLQHMPDVQARYVPQHSLELLHVGFRDSFDGMQHTSLVPLDSHERVPAQSPGSGGDPHVSPKVSGPASQKL